MAECVNCGSYTKYKGGLCLECYKKQKKNTDQNEVSEDSNESSSKKKGMSAKDRNYRYGMIKGRIAETLIQDLFLSLGFNVFNYGMENTIPGIMELLSAERVNSNETVSFCI